MCALLGLLPGQILSNHKARGESNRMTSRHNTLFFFSDEHNPRYSSPYGHPFVKTPVMQRMADNGVVFENGYTASPLCLPCRSAVMAGMRVHEAQAYSNCNVGLNHDLKSYGQALHESGVYSAHFGRSDVYADIEDIGFSYTANKFVRQLPGDVNIVRQPEVQVRKNSRKRAEGYGVRSWGGQKDAENVDLVVDWILNNAPGIEEPWVCVSNVVGPHFPHHCDEEHWEMYADHEDLPEHGPEEASANHPFTLALRKHFECDHFSEEDQRKLRRGYYGYCTMTDKQLGRVIDALDQSGQLETTNVIYFSDHGEMLGKFGAWWKCLLYEDAARVPVIAMGPDFPKGVRIKTPVDLHDVRASAFEAVGVRQPEGWLGTPLQSIPQDDPERVVFSEYHGHGAPAGSYLIRKGNWKLIYYVGAPNQLFDLGNDPEELNNLYDSEAEKAAELETDLREICNPENESERAIAFQKKQLDIIRKEYPEALASEA